MKPFQRGQTEPSNQKPHVMLFPYLSQKGIPAVPK